MTLWEYQVVRINVGPTAPHNQPTQSPAADPVFSETYLKQEFPEHYRPDAVGPNPPTAQTTDPALQLQAFLNSQGKEGWEAIGLQQAGPHTFVIFKRARRQEAEEKSSSENEQLKLTLELASKCLEMVNRQSRSD